MQTHEAENNATVILPLLCSLIGAVAFVCFGMALLNLAEAVPEDLTGSLDGHRAAEVEQQILHLSDSLEAIKRQKAELEHQFQRKREELGKYLEEHDVAEPDLSNEIEITKEQIRQQRETAQELERKIESENTVHVSRIYVGPRRSSEKAQFIECDTDRVLLQPQGQMFTFSDSSQETLAFLSAIKDKEYVVFLVRPNGFSSFWQARKVVEENGIAVGYEPVNEHWRLEFGEKQ